MSAQTMTVENVLNDSRILISQLSTYHDVQEAHFTRTSILPCVVQMIKQ